MKKEMIKLKSIFYKERCFDNKFLEESEVRVGLHKSYLDEDSFDTFPTYISDIYNNTFLPPVGVDLTSKPRKIIPPPEVIIIENDSVMQDVNTLPDNNTEG